MIVDGKILIEYAIIKLNKRNEDSAKILEILKNYGYTIVKRENIESLGIIDYIVAKAEVRNRNE